MKYPSHLPPAFMPARAGKEKGESVQQREQVKEGTKKRREIGNEKRTSRSGN